MNSRGFTLLEVLVSGTILVLVLAGVSTFVILINKQSEKTYAISRSQTELNFLCNTISADVRNGARIDVKTTTNIDTLRISDNELKRTIIFFYNKTTEKLYRVDKSQAINLAQEIKYRRGPEITEVNLSFLPEADNKRVTLNFYMKFQVRSSILYIRSKYRQVACRNRTF